MQATTEETKEQFKKELKEFYKIKKLVKNGKGWAINSRGNKIEWIEYIAEKEK
jgi:hypothetical protein